MLGEGRKIGEKEMQRKGEVRRKGKRKLMNRIIGSEENVEREGREISLLKGKRPGRNLRGNRSITCIAL